MKNSTKFNYKNNNKTQQGQFAMIKLPKRQILVNRPFYSDFFGSKYLTIVLFCIDCLY